MDGFIDKPYEILQKRFDEITRNYLCGNLRVDDPTKYDVEDITWSSKVLIIYFTYQTIVRNAKQKFNDHYKQFKLNSDNNCGVTTPSAISETENTKIKDSFERLNLKTSPATSPKDGKSTDAESPESQKNREDDLKAEIRKMIIEEIQSYKQSIPLKERVAIPEEDIISEKEIETEIEKEEKEVVPGEEDKKTEDGNVTEPKPTEDGVSGLENSDNPPLEENELNASNPGEPQISRSIEGSTELLSNNTEDDLGNPNESNLTATELSNSSDEPAAPSLPQINSNVLPPDEDETLAKTNGGSKGGKKPRKTQRKKSNKKKTIRKSKKTPKRKTQRKKRVSRRNK